MFCSVRDTGTHCASHLFRVFLFSLCYFLSVGLGCALVVGLLYYDLASWCLLRGQGQEQSTCGIYCEVTDGFRHLVRGQLVYCATFWDIGYFPGRAVDAVMQLGYTIDI